MAFKFSVEANITETLVSGKLGTATVAAGGGLLDVDCGKPVKYGADGFFQLCTEGDSIDGFLAAINEDTADGYTFGSIQTEHRIWVTLDGAATLGDFVCAGENAAHKVANTSGYGIVKVDPNWAAEVPTVANAMAFAALNKWKIIGGSVADGGLALIERC